VNELIRRGYFIPLRRISSCDRIRCARDRWWRRWTNSGSFVTRSGLDTAIFDGGGSLLRRNAHLENFPGFPVGVNPRQLLDLMRDQAEEAGCEWHDCEIVDVDRHPDDGFVVKPDGEDR
jgi:thioredoxin reductase